MQKYKLVASKSQKKYTIIVSADSEAEAKEKLHKDGYSLLSISEVGNDKIEGNKFIFQVEKDGELQNGLIIGKDIFKVYKKLKTDLEYHIVFLYPEGDEAAKNAEKKQLIMDQLEIGYKLQQQKEKMKFSNKKTDESFYLKKELDDTYELLAKVIVKLEYVFSHKLEYNVSEEKFLKLEKIYEKLKQIKKSTNLAKLREIGEKALVKIAEIEVENISEKKDQDSKELLKETNSLLKKIGSDKKFKHQDTESSGNFKNFFIDIKTSLSLFDFKKRKKEKKDTAIDTESYNFLKTVLLLEKYKEKLQDNTKEIKVNLFLFLNILKNTERKEKILLKRKVIQQNIAILKAKKNGGVASYTSVKKGFNKIIEGFYGTMSFVSGIGLFFSIIYIYIYLFYNTTWFLGLNEGNFQSENIIIFILLFSFSALFSISKNVFILSGGVVFLSFLHIFVGVNF